MNIFQEVLEEAVNSKEIAGGNLLIIKDGREIVYSQAGYKNIERKEEFSRDTIVRLFSMSKPVTSAAAMILMERGQLDLGSNVEDILPGFKNQHVYIKGKKSPIKRPMIVKELLAMTSGLTYGGELSKTEKDTEELLNTIIKKLRGKHPLTTIEIANRLGKIPLKFNPSESFEYGTSADVMGAIIEVVSGKTFGQFLQDEIFEPLGMKDTGFYIENKENRKRLADAYIEKDGKIQLEVTDRLGMVYERDKAPAFESGGAGLVSTLDDYAKFAQMLINNGKFEDKQILSPSTVKYMTQCNMMDHQKDVLWRGWLNLGGFVYNNFLRVNIDPGLAVYPAWKGEYGWDGWMGTYFANIPEKGVTILFMMQKPDTGTTCVTRKIRGVLAPFLDSLE